MPRGQTRREQKTVKHPHRSDYRRSEKMALRYVETERLGSELMAAMLAVC
jgi:hypothetical protein